jgi:hypothetical protein
MVGTSGMFLRAAAGREAANHVYHYEAPVARRFFTRFMNEV